MPSKGHTERQPVSFITCSFTRTLSSSPSFTMPLPNFAWSVVHISSMLKSIVRGPMM